MNDFEPVTEDDPSLVLDCCLGQDLSMDMNHRLTFPSTSAYPMSVGHGMLPNLPQQSSPASAADPKIFLPSSSHNGVAVQNPMATTLFQSGFSLVPAVNPSPEVFADNRTSTAFHSAPILETSSSACELVTEPDGIQRDLPDPILPDLTYSRGSKPDLLSGNDATNTESSSAEATLLDLSPVNMEITSTAESKEEVVDEAAALASVFSSIPDVAITSGATAGTNSASLIDSNLDAPTVSKPLEPSSAHQPESCCDARTEEELLRELEALEVQMNFDVEDASDMESKQGASVPDQVQLDHAPMDVPACYSESSTLPLETERPPSHSAESSETSVMRDSRLMESHEASPVSSPDDSSSTNASSSSVLGAAVNLVRLGDFAPFWVPDCDADNCMNCDLKFTTFKRRHHCRACGKVLCARCCGGKAPLAYMENKIARVCLPCQEILKKDGRIVSGGTAGDSSTTEDSTDSGGSSLVSPASPQTSPLRPGGSPGGASGWSPNPNNPAEYCSTVPPWQQVQQNAPPPTVMVPVGVLKREGSVSGSRPRSEPKQVMFSDGIRPGGDLTELTDEPEGATGRGPNPRSVAHHRSQRKAALAAAAAAAGTSGHSRSRARGGAGASGVAGQPTKPRLPGMLTAALSFVRGSLPLPPTVSYDRCGDLKLEHCADVNRLIDHLRDENADAVTFALTKNLHVRVKIVNLHCCVFRECWCFLTSGMQTAAQDEILILLERLPDENEIPRDVFNHFLDIYERCSKGQFVMALGHSLLNNSSNPGVKSTFLGSTDYGGFLYIRPSLQCLKNVLVPPPGTPFLVGLLLQKWELPWAKILPLRLALRLGAEFRYYPCPLFSVRNRKPLFCEIGHTIIKLLADFRQYAYTVPTIPGMVIHMEEKQTSVRIPRNRYDCVMKAVGNSNDHVMAFAGNFSPAADSHLVCIQNEDGNYQTQAINIQNRPRKVTGASFLVFNGALKTSSGLSAKSSIVEDGLMVHIPAETMSLLRSALREMNDFEVGCGPLADADPDELVVIQWVADDKAVNVGVRSPIDGLSFEGVKSVRIPSSTDYLGEARLVRWTELFLLRVEEGDGPWSEPLNISRMAEGISRATCVALIPHLDRLKRSTFSRIGLRATIDVENVCYEVGSNGSRLPSDVLNDLDSELIPVIHRAASSTQDAPSITLELIFHIMDQ